MMYKHSHTCWAHSHPLLPKQQQSVSQFSPSSLPESPSVSVFSGRKVLHGQSSLALAQVMICFGCHCLSNLGFPFIEHNLLKWLVSAIPCQVGKLRKHIQKQRQSDGQKTGGVRIKAAKIRQRNKCARANRPPMLLRSQKLEGNSAQRKWIQ